MDFVTTKFKMPLWEAFELVRSTDLFLGMHGAGFGNLLALHQVIAWQSQGRLLISVASVITAPPFHDRRAS